MVVSSRKIAASAAPLPSASSAAPSPASGVGQLVWCPSDPSIGIGVVTEKTATRVRVRFVRLQEERLYTTRGSDLAIWRYIIQVGEKVTLRNGKSSRVLACLPGVPESPLYHYKLADETQRVESELLPILRDVGAKQRLANLNLVHPDVVRARLHGLRLQQLGQQQPVGLGAMLGARVQWLPHQLDVASRAISQDPVRLLLADEVGLGKTVEAALIYAGLRQEGRAARVLILVPEALCIQWLGEIYRKTHELLVLLDAARCADAAQDFADLSPFEAYQRMVVSLDRLVDDASLRAQLASSQWDLVICDEAHHLRWEPNPSQALKSESSPTLRRGNTAYQLLEMLATRTRHLLLLTATPMALDPTEYHALLRLLDASRFDDPLLFARVAQRVDALREVALSLQQCSLEQQALPTAVQQAARRLLADDATDSADLEAFLALPATAPQRLPLAEQVLAHLRQRHGLTDYVVRNRRGPVGGLPQRLPQVVALKPSAAQEVLLEVGETIMLELVQSLPQAQQKRALGELLRALWASPRALSDILQPYSAALTAQLQPYVQAVLQAPVDAEDLPSGDQRLRWLVQHVRALPKSSKILVFVESVVAVRALRDALEPFLAGNLTLFYQSLAPRDQDRQVAYFRDPAGPQVLLCTEAGGEGRNFQFCHHIVLYDLPWRPATVEQRIGRIDRVGQKNDVYVWVPHFASGYEAAVLKVMHQSIGVLQRTVGGIDHALEYVSDQLADLILSTAPVATWKKLFLETHHLVSQAQQRVDADNDPILDYTSFSAPRVQALLATVPDDLEARTEALVRHYAEHSKLLLHSKGAHCVTLEGAPGAAGGTAAESGYVATFSRTYALDHEDVEFLSLGHPLVNQALQWATQAQDSSAALALCRGCDSEGAVFIWSFSLDFPDDAPAAATYFATRLYTFACDETGRRRPEFETLLSGHTKRLERMDPTPLRGAIQRWRKVCEANYEVAASLAQQAVESAAQQARQSATAALQQRQRHLQRAQQRALHGLAADSTTYQTLQAEYHRASAALAATHQHLQYAMTQVQPSLAAVVALRLLRARQVSV